MKAAGYQQAVGYLREGGTLMAVGLPGEAKLEASIFFTVFKVKSNFALKGNIYSYAGAESQHQRIICWVYTLVFRFRGSLSCRIIQKPPRCSGSSRNCRARKSKMSLRDQKTVRSQRVSSVYVLLLVSDWPAMLNVQRLRRPGERDCRRSCCTKYVWVGYDLNAACNSTLNKRTCSSECLLVELWHINILFCDPACKCLHGIAFMERDAVRSVRYPLVIRWKILFSAHACNKLEN